MFNTIVGARAVGAGAALRYSSGSSSDQKMRLLARSSSTTLMLTNILDRVSDIRERGVSAKAHHSKIVVELIIEI
jgi:hypothetical protein